MFKSKNVFDLKYFRNPEVNWQELPEGLVEIELVHTGPAAWVAQKVFKRPKSSWIKLDALGSCVWYELEHSHDIQTTSAAVHEQFGDEAEPLLPRLGQFINLLERYGFIQRQV